MRRFTLSVLLPLWAVEFSVVILIGQASRALAFAVLIPGILILVSIIDLSAFICWEKRGDAQRHRDIPKV